MKLYRLIRSIPFLTLLLIILLINLNNKKELTNIRILIWETPLLSLGTYISISASTGFIISYLITNKIVNSNKITPLPEINGRSVNHVVESNMFNERNQEKTYENTLIERDIKDPSPTVNASFRVIGNNNRKYQDNEYFGKGENNIIDNTDESEYQGFDQENKLDEIPLKPIRSDWEVDTYSNW